ncbi:ABC transporter ATP-binding protein [Actinomadura verrucosospora]|uniref:Branched-chain amino acid ABC transporter ATP-binding protein n=1 Tax=Actinomadura verrucosospora TaxID=46165 RepID=A0A7D3VXF5_ACTVE|nr:ABC transporter ATP-binding protein [Actinomadura verrucosospora]QKG21436.1 branched-chain amino acid ABC transporter ATP-binding protein [Actinomadura verrucosospora]
MRSLELDGVSVGRGGAPIVRDVSLAVPAGEVTVLLGPNGAGKTTLLEAVAGVLPIASGRITGDGDDIVRLDRVRRARRGIALVEQGRTVFAQLTVAENLRAVRRGPAADRALEPFPELRRRMDVRAGLLSGGEQQMVVLARALAMSPSVLLIDEMSLGLAPVIVKRLLPAVRALADGGVAVLLVEQFATLALGIADTAHVLAGGRLTHSGPAAPLRKTPDVLHAAYLGGV